MMTPTPRRYRGISAEERRAARRRQLLDAALEIAGTRGVERTTMTAICSEAGLTERYFYESFDARDQLLLALVDEIAEQVRTAVLTALSDTEGDTAARAHAALAAFAAVLVSAGWYVAIFELIPANLRPYMGGTQTNSFLELVLGYKDRALHVPAGAMEQVVPGGNGMFRATVVVDGIVAATWTRTMRSSRVDVAVRWRS